MTIRRIYGDSGEIYAALHENIVYLAPINGQSNIESFSEQARGAVEKVERILDTLGLKKSDILSCEVRLRDIVDADVAKDILLGWIDGYEPPISHFGEVFIDEIGSQIQLIIRMDGSNMSIVMQS